ncbi:hypothetical protein [Pontibacter cellulosilyticus]|uniref:Uncharacterized protein n=1 Tax=Pontibacter cellulosilyticus TaxID=1720253 RepID=A0A923N7R1_9BACT|nr:hypothetical protein [Pontibacter cellulosilyticus]MBC5992432.1 hypothetical protein [Pontibacter cellulosilyticus]
MDLETGFAVLGFDDYQEFRRVRQLCEEKSKAIAYAGRLERIREIQAKNWVYYTHQGWQDYAHRRAEYYTYNPEQPRPKGLLTAKESIVSAAAELGRRAGYVANYVIVARK